MDWLFFLASHLLVNIINRSPQRQKKKKKKRKKGRGETENSLFVNYKAHDVYFVLRLGLSSIKDLLLNYPQCLW